MRKLTQLLSVAFAFAVCYGIYLWLGLYAALGYALFNLIVGAWLGFELVHTRCSDD